MDRDALVRRLLINWWVALGLAAFLLAGHVAWAWSSRNGADLARCGALWAVLSGVILARPVLRVGYAEWYDDSRTVGGGSFVPTERDRLEARQTELDARAVQVVGPSLLVAGTLLWGYGDLLGAWFFPPHP